jgi:hypothetical protein
VPTYDYRGIGSRSATRHVEEWGGVDRNFVIDHSRLAPTRVRDGHSFGSRASPFNIADYHAAVLIAPRAAAGGTGRSAADSMLALWWLLIPA